MTESTSSSGQAATPPPPKYRIENAVLHVSKDPKFNDPEFQRQCDLLLECPESLVTLELTRVAYLQSPEIACLFLFLKKAKDRGKAVDIRVSRTVLIVLKNMNLHRLAGLHAADAPVPD